MQLSLGIGIGCDVLENDEVVLYGIEAFALAIVVRCTVSRSCTMAASEADCGFTARRVRWHELYSTAFNLALLPIRAGF
jgi:hypothetical protein